MRQLNKILILLAVPVLIFAQQTLTLEDCRKRALIHNHKIKIARENRSAAESNVKRSRTAFLPKISFTGSYLHMTNKFNYEIDEMSIPIGNKDGSFDAEHLETVTGPDGNPLTNPDGSPVMMPKNWLHFPGTELKLGEHNNYMLNVGLTQPLFTGGKILQQYKISKSMAAIAKEQEVLSNSEVILKTDELFWKIISVTEKVKLAQEYVNLVKTHIEELNHYLDEGLITNNALLKAKVKLNEAKMNLLKAENGRELAKMALCQHIGLPLQRDIQLQQSKEPKVMALNQQIVNDQGAENRRELSILQKQIDINRSVEKIAFSRYLPDIVLTSNYMTLNPNPYNSFEDEFGSDITVGVSAQFEIFNWNARGHKRASARHLRKAAEQRYEESKAMIKLDIQQAAFRVNEAVKKITLAESNMEQAEENLAVTRDNFKEGLAKSTDVLDAQTLWQDAKSELIDSKSEYQINLTHYKKAIGQLSNKEQTIN
ncbi:MAG: TolC family protein [Fidelibacterota bacterium]